MYNTVVLQESVKSTPQCHPKSSQEFAILI